MIAQPPRWLRVANGMEAVSLVDGLGATSNLEGMLMDVAVLVRMQAVIVAYAGFSYRVFRGKTIELYYA